MPTLRRRSSIRATSALSEEDRAKFAELSLKPYKEQAKWFLNAFWNDTFAADPAECENVWIRANQFINLDHMNGADGCELDEFMSHKFLETLGETLTVLKLREKLRTIDIDMNGSMSLTEYMLYKYDKAVPGLVRPQADPAEIKVAQGMVEEAQRACDEMKARLEESKEKVREQNEKLAEQKRATEAATQAKLEATATLQALNNEKEQFNKLKADLKAKSQTGGVVSRNKAAAELAQLEAKDPLPLQRAQINQAAAVRAMEKAEKAQQKAEEAAAEAKQRADEAKEVAEAAVETAKQKIAEAVEFLQEVKSRAGSSEGTVWWLEREMKEMDKYRPRRNQSVLKATPAA